MALRTVAVLFGGRSSEHEISLRSAVFILKNIPRDWKILPVAITRNGAWFSIGTAKTSEEWKTVLPQFETCSNKDLQIAIDTFESGNSKNLGHQILIQEGAFCGQKIEQLFAYPCRKEVLKFSSKDQQNSCLNLKCDAVFPVLHGPNGEDGRLQGLFELAEIPIVGCNSVVSALGMDKNFQKVIARDAGIAVAKYEVVSLEEWHQDEKNGFSNILDRVEKSIGYPNFCKPNALGSAVGVNRSRSRQELQSHLAYALSFDERALVEEPMHGTEVECSFLGTPANILISTPGEIAAADFYSYDAKYESEDGAKTFIPARLSAEKTQLLQDASRTIAKALCLEGLCRIDFWNCHKTGRFVFNEVNSLPGMTSISMFPKLLEQDGIFAKEWIAKVLEHSVMRNLRLMQRSVKKS